MPSTASVCSWKKLKRTSKNEIRCICSSFVCKRLHCTFIDSDVMGQSNGSHTWNQKYHHEVGILQKTSNRIIHIPTGKFNFFPGDSLVLKFWSGVNEICFFQYKSYQPIRGIKHLDYKSHPSNVKFLKGAIGSFNVSLEVTSQSGHGIQSSFIFYG